MAIEVVSVAEACHILGCKKTRLFELLADGTLTRAPRYGRAIRIYMEGITKALRPGALDEKHTVRAPRARRSRQAHEFSAEEIPL